MSSRVRRISRVMQILLTGLALAQGSFLAAREKLAPRKSLEDYVRRMQQQPIERSAVNPGSLWTDGGSFTDLASDYKARRLGDLVTILVVQDVQAQNTGNVSADRSFNTNSGIGSLAGHISTSGVNNIFSASSAQTLQGKAQSSSSSSLRTRLTGQVVALLSNGLLVVEAEREVTMNNEKQTVVLRGLVRPGDLGADNAISSNALGNLELELKGKGVVSDGVRPPNVLMRWLLRLVGF